MTVYIDADGLTHIEPENLLVALGLGALPRIFHEPENRALLRSGDTVLTGPWGAVYWLMLPHSVTVRVLPDDYVMQERETPEVWAGLALGLSRTDAVRLAKAQKPPKGRLGEYWEPRKLLLAALPEPQKIASALRGDISMLSSTETLALDWEWRETDGQPLGLAWAEAGDAGYVPMQTDGTPRADGLPGVFAERLTAGRPSILHGGRADLATQFPGDPLEVVAGGVCPHDTMILAYLAGERRLGLKDLTKRVLGREAVAYPGPLEALPVEEIALYAAADARNTYDLFAPLCARVKARGHWQVYEDLERPLVPIIASMEKYGVPVDMPEAIRLRDHYAVEANALATENPALTDDKAARRWLAECLGYDPGTTDQRTIAQWQHPAIDTLLAYRKARTLARNFLGKHVERWEAAGQPEEYRVYPAFNQAGDFTGDKAAPRSGRLSSSGPNLQNQPEPIRSIFVPPAGRLWWRLDYNQLELRLAAYLSGDPAMQEALQGDMHEALNQEVARLTGSAPGRPAAKNANFEVLYGGGPAKLQRMLTLRRVFISRTQAEALHAAHRRLFPGYHAWVEKETQRCLERGYGETIYGRRRYESGLASADGEIRSHAVRAVINHAIQGTAADVVKAAMIRLVPTLLQYGAHLAVQVHDELAGWAPESEAQGFLTAAQAVCEDGALGLTVAKGLGRNWREAK